MSRAHSKKENSLCISRSIALVLMVIAVCLLLLSGCNGQSSMGTRADTKAKPEQPGQTEPIDKKDTSDSGKKNADGKRVCGVTSSWIVPDGFREADTDTPPSGVKFRYYSSSLDMTIEVWESSINYLPFSTTDEWLEYDYNAYMSSSYGDTPVYDYRNDSKIVVSGYRPDGSVYYIMETAASPRIYSVTFEYPSGSNKELCDEIVGQFMESFNYQTTGRR